MFMMMVMMISVFAGSVKAVPFLTRDYLSFAPSPKINYFFKPGAFRHYPDLRSTVSLRSVPVKSRTNLVFPSCSSRLLCVHSLLPQLHANRGRQYFCKPFYNIVDF